MKAKISDKRDVDALAEEVKSTEAAAQAAMAEVESARPAVRNATKAKVALLACRTSGSPRRPSTTTCTATSSRC